MVIACPVRGKQKSVDICRAFIEGSPRKAFGYVFYGVNESNWRNWQIVQRSGEPWFYIDNSFFDVVRGQQFRVAKNRVQTLVGEQTSDGKRFDALGLTIAEWDAWESNNRNWLVVEQSESFMRYVANEPDWLEERAKSLPFGRMSEMRVRRWERDKLKQQTTLAADLEWADSVLAHSSAAAVEAVLVGVPIIVSKMSALAGMVCGRAESAHRDERRRYLSVLADNQFSLEAFRSGEAWAHLQKS